MLKTEAEPTAEALVAAGLEHHQAGRHGEADRCYAHALAIDPREATALYLLGLLTFETGQPARAVVLLQEVADLRPGNIEACFTLAGVRHWLGDHVAAIADYQAVLERQTDHAGALVGLANAMRDSGDLEAALTAARAAVAAHPTLAAAQAAFAATLGSVGQSLAAASAWREAIRLGADDAPSHVGLSLALIQAGEPSQALRAAERALEIDPGPADAWFAKGAALSGLHRYGDAVEALERSVEIDPDRAAVQLALGNAYAELERIGEAEQRLKAAIALDPWMSEVHASLGAVYLMADQPETARTCYEIALAIDPDMVAAHQSLAGLLADAGEPAEARRHRDLAYRAQNLFVETAAEPRARVLILTTAEGGNTPFRYLLPKDRYDRITWFIEYAEDGQAARLPDHDIVFNAIGDADFAGATSANVEAFLGTNRRPVLNDPAKVARTTRDLTPGLLAGLDDVVVPPVVRTNGWGLEAAMETAGLAPPVLMRPIGSHGGKGLVRADTAEDLAAIALGADDNVYLTAYRDFRSADGFYRKYRMIFVGRRAYPYHLAISRDWLVHHGSAGMADDPSRIAEELGFLLDPASAIGARAMAAVAAIGERLDLDYAGLDFSVLEDGRVLVFEANATMLVHPEPPNGAFAHKTPFVARILDAFQAMVAARQG